MDNILYIEPICGVSGDMLSGALLDLIGSKEEVFRELNSLSIKDEFSLELNSINKNSLQAKKFNVLLPKKKYSHRTEDHHGRKLSEIVEIINSGSLISDKAKNLAIKIFNRLAVAEGKVHNSSIEKVHFHEVGAIDSIIDILATSICVTKIAPDEVVSTTIPLGRGKISTEHGILPIPAPATLNLAVGLPTEIGSVEGELSTPTGVAILAEIVTDWNKEINGVILKLGNGAGTKDFRGIANILRASLINGMNKVDTDTVSIIETNVDDMPGEFFSHLESQLFKCGALDYAILPASMKKGRSGFIIQVISKLEDKDLIIKSILQHTTSLGVRYREEKRVILSRRSVNINTKYGKISAKISYNDTLNIKKIKPEFDDVSKIALEKDLPFQQVYNEILAECIQRVNL